MKVLFIDPKPQARTRHTRNGKPYYTRPMQRYLTSLIDLLSKTYESGRFFDSKTPVKVEATFYLRKTRTAVSQGLHFPIAAKSGDVDNFLKAFLDCVTKSTKVFNDDGQVVTAICRKRYHSFGAIVCEISEERDLFEFDRKWLDFGNPGQIMEMIDVKKRLSSS